MQAVEDQLGTRAQPDLVCGGDSPPLPPRVRASEKLVWDGKPGIWLCVYWGWGDLEPGAQVSTKLPSFQAWILLDPSAMKSLVESIFGLQSSLRLSLPICTAKGTDSMLSQVSLP